MNPRPALRNARESATKRSQAESSTPGTPVSASTVTGVLCDAAAFGSLPLRCVRSAYARLNPPSPTPCTGWCAAIASPFVTSLNRPPDAAFSDRSRVLGSTSATTTRTTSPAASTAAARQRQTYHDTTAVAAINAKKLDCENENTSPTQMPAIARDDASTTLRDAPSKASTRQARIATTRNRP